MQIHHLFAKFVLFGAMASADLAHNSGIHRRTTSSDSGLPPLSILLSPNFSSSDDPVSMNVTLAFALPTSIPGNSSLLTAYTEMAAVPCISIEEGSLTAIVGDAIGDLELSAVEDSSTSQMIALLFRTNRSIAANTTITVSYVALPRIVNSTAASAPAFDFRQDGQGFVGSGYGFLVAPATDIYAGKFDVSLSWDLSAAPSGTRAVWTFGEGTDGSTNKRTTTADMVQFTYFAVGPAMESVPTVASTVSANETTKDFGAYWLGSPPWNATELALQVREMFYVVSDFFEDDENAYRVFFRHNPYWSTGSGTAFSRSFAFSYDDSNDQGTEQSRLNTLVHEIVHNWVGLSESAPSYENWYAEGMAEYYSMMLQWRHGTLNDEDYVDAVNEKLSCYYTGPLTNWTIEETSDVTWENADAQRVPYCRGFTFAHQVNGIIVNATNGSKSIDNVVLSIVQLSRAGEEVMVQKFIELVGEYIENETLAQQLYDEMANGTLVVPDPQSLAYMLPVTVERADQYGWELGFDEASAKSGDRVIDGVKEGSRAARAGLRDGDVLQEPLLIWNLKEDYAANITAQVLRNGSSALNITWWPRTYELKESYQYVWV